MLSYIERLMQMQDILERARKDSQEGIMTYIEGIKICMCVDMDCTPDHACLTDNEGQSVQVLICPVCGGQQIEEE